MSFFKKSINTEKELELVATIYDFLEEVMAESDITSYGMKEAKMSLRKKSKTLEELIEFDLDQYKNVVDHNLLLSVRDIKSALRDELYAWIQEDKETINGSNDAYKVEQLIREAREAQYRLQSSIRTFKIEFNKFTERYISDHNGKDPENDIETYSIRKKDKN